MSTPGPAYDCGDPDCEECRRAFGPDRSKAIARFREREAAYDALRAETWTAVKVSVFEATRTPATAR